MILNKYIEKNLRQINENLKTAKLLAVSKHSSTNDILSAYYAGQRHFGENRVQELVRKAKEAEGLGLSEINWHFIGRVQTNKVKQLLSVERLKYIHSVDSIKLLNEIFKRKDNIPGKIYYFLQVNTSNELQKGGFAGLESLFEGVNYILSQNNSDLNFLGLMTMGKLRTDNFEVDARNSFINLRKLKIKIEKTFSVGELQLSMGMSQDYKIAIEEGANWVRIGSVIFGT